MKYKTHNAAALDALGHIRRFLEYNKNETLTGHHDAYERLKATRIVLTPEEDKTVSALDNLLARVLNMAHEYAEKAEVD